MGLMKPLWLDLRQRIVTVSGGGPCLGEGGLGNVLSGIVPTANNSGEDYKKISS